MTQRLLETTLPDLISPSTALGAAFYGLLFLGAAILLVRLVRRSFKRAEQHFTDVTGLRYASYLVQVLIFIVAFVLYAQFIPELSVLATAALAGVSIASVIVGLAAQHTLGNLIAGLSLVLYRPFSVGDEIQMATPKGLVTAKIERLSLGHTLLRDSEGFEIVVPNSVMISIIFIRVSEKKV